MRDMAKFAEALKATLAEQEMTVYALARRLDPDNPQRTERNIYRWLSGTKPSKISREAVEDALDLERDALDGEDDEEDSPAMQQLARAFRDVVREETERA